MIFSTDKARSTLSCMRKEVIVFLVMLVLASVSVSAVQLDYDFGSYSGELHVKIHGFGSCCPQWDSAYDHYHSSWSLPEDPKFIAAGPAPCMNVISLDEDNPTATVSIYLPDYQFGSVDKYQVEKYITKTVWSSS